MFRVQRIAGLHVSSYVFDGTTLTDSVNMWIPASTERN